MRRRLWLFIGAAAMVVLGVTGGSLALFRDSTAASQEFTTATVRIDSYRDNKDSVPGPMFYTTTAEGTIDPLAPGLKPTGLWTPGDTWKRVLMVKNIGTADVWLTGVSATKESGSDALAAKLHAVVALDLAGTKVLAEGSLADFFAGTKPFSSKVDLAVGKLPKALYFIVSLPLDTGDTFQGGSVKASFTVYAEQKKNNP